MIYWNGQKWEKLNYKITYMVETFGQTLDGFPENATAEEITLSTEQQSRLNEIQNIEMTENEAIAYVKDGAGVIPDNRTETDKLLDLVPDVYEAIDHIPEWEENTLYLKNSRMKHEGKVYRSRQTHTSLKHQPPDLEGMLAIYLPYTPPGQITDYDPNRNLGADYYRDGELVRFPEMGSHPSFVAGVYQSTTVHAYNPWDYMGNWTKRDDLV